MLCSTPVGTMTTTAVSPRRRGRISRSSSSSRLSVSDAIDAARDASDAPSRARRVSENSASRAPARRRPPHTAAAEVHRRAETTTAARAPSTSTYSTSWRRHRDDPAAHRRRTVAVPPHRRAPCGRGRGRSAPGAARRAPGADRRQVPDATRRVRLVDGEAHRAQRPAVSRREGEPVRSTARSPAHVPPTRARRAAARTPSPCPDRVVASFPACVVAPTRRSVAPSVAWCRASRSRPAVDGAPRARSIEIGPPQQRRRQPRARPAIGPATVACRERRAATALRARAGSPCSIASSAADTRTDVDSDVQPRRSRRPAIASACWNTSGPPSSGAARAALTATYSAIAAHPSRPGFAEKAERDDRLAMSGLDVTLGEAGSAEQETGLGQVAHVTDVLE